MVRLVSVMCECRFEMAGSDLSFLGVEAQPEINAESFMMRILLLLSDARDENVYHAHPTQKPHIQLTLTISAFSSLQHDLL